MAQSSDRTQEIIAASLSISDKIRALTAEGHKRADIARLLGKRYQYVRNVLEGDKHRKQPPLTPATTAGPWPAQGFGVAEGPITMAPGVVRLKLADDGSVRFPSWALSALRLQPGSILIGELLEDRLVLLTPQAAMRKARDRVKHLATGVSIVDELIADRRREAERDRTDG